MSCTPPMKIEPTRIHNSAGSQPNIDAGQNRPDDRPGRGDRRKMLAQQKLRLDRHIVEVVAQLDGRRRPARIELQQSAQEAAVGDIGDATARRPQPATTVNRFMSAAPRRPKFRLTTAQNSRYRCRRYASKPSRWTRRPRNSIIPATRIESADSDFSVVQAR